MCSYSSVADLAARMRIEPDALLERLHEAGVDKADARDPVYDADVAALSELYRKLLGPRAIEIAAEVRAEANPIAETPTKLKANRVILVGNLGDDPKVRYIPSGEAVTNVRLTVAHRYLRLLKEVYEGYVTGDRRSHLFLELLQGRVPAKLRRMHRQLVREDLYASIEESRRAHRLCELVARARSFLMGRVVACHLSDREATIHPAFAPPAAVI